MQPGGEAVARRWLKQQAVSSLPYDIGCCKPGTKSAICDSLVFIHDVHVRLSVLELVSEIAAPIFAEIFLRVTYGRGSVLL